jgi:site-specific DNA-methyltransferase (adenine-specific)
VDTLSKFNFGFDMVFADPPYLLGRKFLGLEIEDEFLTMSKARRMELDNNAIRHDILTRLIKSNIIPPDNEYNLFAEPLSNYGVPW